MANYDLSGTIAGSSTATGLIDISYRGSNQPPYGDGSKISQYFDPAAPTTSSVVPGLPQGKPNSASVPLTPFLRMTFTSDNWATDVDSGIELIVPSGVLEGDLMVITHFQRTPWGYAGAGSWLASGWTQQATLLDAVNTTSATVWTRVATKSDAGKRWAVSGGTEGTYQVRVYGNAVFGNARITENAIGSGGQTTTAATSDAPVNGVVMYAWPGNYSTFYTATVPSPLGNVALSGNIFSADLAVVANSQPGRTATVSPTPTAPGFQVVVELKPLQVFRYATVDLMEAVGAGQDTVAVDSYVHLMGADEHSPQLEYGFTQAGMNDTGSGTVYSYERWVRVRFNPNFNTVRAFRFWAPNLTAIPTGWSVKYGTTNTYATPMNTASSIATSPVPTSDPGQSSPNAGGATWLAGTGTQYSDWIVLQASADTAVVGPGPVLGFSLEGTLIPIEFSFAWTET